VRSCHLGRSTLLAGWLLACYSFQWSRRSPGFKAGAGRISRNLPEGPFRGEKGTPYPYQRRTLLVGAHWGRPRVGSLLVSYFRADPMSEGTRLLGESSNPPEELIFFGEMWLVNGREERETRDGHQRLARPDAYPVLVRLFRMVLREVERAQQTGATFALDALNSEAWGPSLGDLPTSRAVSTKALCRESRAAWRSRQAL